MSDLEHVYDAGQKVPGIRLAATEALQLWRQHCNTVHGATRLSDYRDCVAEWHRETHPDCEWDIGSWHWRDVLKGRSLQRVGTDGIER